MKVLFYCLSSQPVHRTVSTVLSYFAKDYPQDRYHLVCREGSGLTDFRQFPNCDVTFVEDDIHREWSRLRFAMTKLAPLARKVHADVIWSINTGLYHRIEIPQVVTMINPYVSFPPHMSRYHPKGRAVATVLRFFGRRSIARSSGVLVETSFIADQIRKIKGAPQEIGVVLKAVETDAELGSQPLSDALKKQLVCAP